MDDTETLAPAPVQTAPPTPAPEIERFERYPESPFQAAQISWRDALTMAIAWIASMAMIEAVAPAPDPDAVLTGFEMFMTLGYTSALLLGAVGLALRQRIGVIAAIGGGGLFVLGSISCWMGGHVGSWIAVQAVLGAAMMLLGSAVLRRS